MPGDARQWLTWDLHLTAQLFNDGSDAFAALAYNATTWEENKKNNQKRWKLEVFAGFLCLTVYKKIRMDGKIYMFPDFRWSPEITYVHAEVSEVIFTDIEVYQDWSR